MISLVIPMYNSEQTIEKTLESVVEQTVQFTEVIVVDNGSSDQSVSIVETFCNHHAFIHLVYCEQRGVSAARNKGIDMATAEYISFLDADDILAHDYVEVLESFVLQNQNADMYHFNFYHQFKNGIIKENLYFLHDQLSYSGCDFMEKTLQNFSFEAKHMVWAFLFRKQFLTAHQLCFDSQISLFEDIVFLHEVWNCQPDIVVLNRVLLTYCWNSKSATNTPSVENVERGLNKLYHMQSVQLKVYARKLSSRILSYKKFNAFWQKEKIPYYRLLVMYVWYKLNYFFFRLKQKIK